MTRRADFFNILEQAVTFKKIEGKDTRNATETFIDVDLAQVSKGGSSMPADSAIVPSNSIRVFIKAIPEGLEKGDTLALSRTRESARFDYTILDIDETARGTRAGRRYPVRIEATRRA